jgi:peptidoglycan/LPS O-acetylase OafA/YrhL
MWIPWSLIGLYAIGHLRSKLIANKAITLPLLIIGTGALLIVQPLVGDTITIFDNKYPPDLLFIGYGITAVTLFYWLFSVQTVQRQPWLTKPLGFFSIYSYPIYFIHYLVLYVAEQYDLSPMMHPLMFFVIVLTVTAALMAGIARFKIV